ncbi:MAG: SDR family NAD(P)-dependent oxidoreductase [Promethearchaeota archaeon]
MTEKIILISGSTDGIGYQAAIELVKSDFHVIIHGRNKEKAEFTLGRIKSITKRKNVSIVYADLCSFNQIKEMANDINNNYDRLDVLINNAGVFKPERSLTEEGFESTFAVNYIAPFLLTNLLLESLKKSKSGKIVNVVSRVHSNHFDFNDLQFKMGYTGVKAYAKSKTALILFTYALAEKLKNINITINCLHPGVINTKLLRSAYGTYGAPVLEGAKTLIYAATAPELKNVTGKYFVNNHPEPSKDITYNKETMNMLWSKTEELIGLKFDLL